MSPRDRVRFIDFARTLAVLNMVAFHFCFDYFIVCGNDSGWYDRWYIHVWQQMICWTFILVSGISWHFSPKNLRKGLLLNLCGLLVTAVTVLALPSQAVWFGVLNLLGCSTWLLCLLAPALENCPPAAGLLVSFFCFGLTYHLQSGLLGLGPFCVTLPEAWYQYKPFVVVGLPFPGFVSSDYFPLLPWFCLFLCGYFLWRLPAFRQLCVHLSVPSTRRISQRSLWIYLLHQPVCMGLAWALNTLL